MHQSSLDKMTDFCARYLDFPDDGHQRTVIDLGSQDINGTYRPLFDPKKWRYLGIDMAAGKNVDIVLRDPYRWREIRTASADCVISGQAFEHTEYFWLSTLEIASVLKPGALCCIIAPSTGPEHRYPVDCWRFYPDGMTALARYAELECLHAATSWDQTGYLDGSNMFCDTVLIARKPASAKRFPRWPWRRNSVG